MTQRDVLVVLREELARARKVLLETELTDADLAAAAQKLTASVDALEVRIRATFDALLLERAARTFRAAAADLDRLLALRLEQRRRAPEVQRVLKRVVVHAREVGRMTHQSGSDHVAAAIESLAVVDAWTGAPLDALIGLVDTLYSLARRRLGDAARPQQVSSLVDRSASTAVVTCLHALKELAGRVRSEPTLMRDRFQLDAALKATSVQLVERLAGWFKLEDDGRRRLHEALARFIRALLDRAIAGAVVPR